MFHIIIDFLHMPVQLRTRFPTTMLPYVQVLIQLHDAVAH